MLEPTAAAALTVIVGEICLLPTLGSAISGKGWFFVPMDFLSVSAEQHAASGGLKSTSRLAT